MPHHPSVFTFRPSLPADRAITDEWIGALHPAAGPAHGKLPADLEREGKIAEFTAMVGGRAVFTVTTFPALPSFGKSVQSGDLVVYLVCSPWVLEHKLTDAWRSAVTYVSALPGVTGIRSEVPVTDMKTARILRRLGFKKIGSGSDSSGEHTLFQLSALLG